MHTYLSILKLVFQSTPSVWRETIYIIHHLRIATNISIHSLRMEGDRSKVSVLLPVMPFQSTPSVWRET